LSNGVVQIVAPNDGGKSLWVSTKNATSQPFPINDSAAIGPFSAYTPEASGVNNFFVADASGNQIYPSSSSSTLKDIIKAIKAVVKIVNLFS
jgi:hypothetical protein